MAAAAPSSSSGGLLTKSISELIILRFDGAAKGNPGPAGCGYVLLRSDGSVIDSGGKSVGINTNNVAEYNGFIEGLRCAIARGFRRIHIEGDSMLICNQMLGKWKINFAHLRELHDTAQAELQKLDFYEIVQIPREQNRLADIEANKCIIRT